MDFKVAKIKFEEGQQKSSEETTIKKDIFKISYPSLQNSCIQKDSWSIAQNCKYTGFIFKNRDRMEGCPHKQLWKIYIEMSSLIKSRNFRQCKSYHQKMLIQHKGIEQIVNFLTQSYPTVAFYMKKQKKQNEKPEDYREKKQFVDHECNKEKDSNLPKTSDSYLNQKKTYPSLGEFETIFQSNNYQLEINEKIMNRRAELDQEWRQCHRLFIEWLTKLQQLNMTQQHLYQPF